MLFKKVMFLEGLKKLFFLHAKSPVFLPNGTFFHPADADA